jgi:hypothetical protein
MTEYERFGLVFTKTRVGIARGLKILWKIYILTYEFCFFVTSTSVFTECPKRSI